MTLSTVPNLKLALTGPLAQLEKNILENQIKIESWFRRQWQLTSPSFYSSIDLRNAGFKLAQVDTNLFPAGFNNINPEFTSLCVQAAQETLERVLPGCQSILLIPENHTRNLKYLENVKSIKNILEKAGFEVRLGRLPEFPNHNADMPEEAQIKLNIQTVERKGNRLYLDDFSPCLILLNHDLSDGIPPSLEGLEQLILPEPKLSWDNRLKSQHFAFYQSICEEFAKLIGIDPWLINPLFRRCEEVNFLEKGSEPCLEKHTEELFLEIQKKYDEYNIQQKPFIVIKADSGTYGMGIMMIHDPKEVYELNRKQRKKMSSLKGGRKINKVIIQEGVYSFETIQNQVAEPVVYMIGKNVIGGFYRIHKDKASNENLNSPGMHFESLAFNEPCNVPEPDRSIDCYPNRFYTYGVIARLATLAAARESYALK